MISNDIVRLAAHVKSIAISGANGHWSPGITGGAVVTSEFEPGDKDAEYYGGALICESASQSNAATISACQPANVMRLCDAILESARDDRLKAGHKEDHRNVLQVLRKSASDIIERIDSMDDDLPF